MQEVAVGRCVNHAELEGTPCARCGTFGCTVCLVGSLCERCRLTGLRVPQPEDTVEFWPRAGARVIDSVVRVGVGFAAGVVAAVVLAVGEGAGAVPPGWQERMQLGLLARSTMGVVSALLGVTLVTVLSGASVGKLVCSLRVVSQDGSPVGLRGAFVRELLYLVDSFFFGLVGKSAMDGSPLHQRHGDALGRTVVVRAQTRHGPGLAETTLRVLLGLVGEALVSAALFVVAVW